MSQKHLSSCCCWQPSICNPCPLSYFRQVLSFSTCWLAVDLLSADQHSFLFVVHSSIKFKTAVILRTKISLHGKCHVKTVYCTNKHITGSNFLRCYVATVVTYTGCINRIGLDLWFPSPQVNALQQWYRIFIVGSQMIIIPIGMLLFMFVTDKNTQMNQYTK